MSIANDDILAAALQLPEPQRAQMVQDLLDSLSPDAEVLVDDAWATELDQRLMEFQQGRADAIAWSELREKK